MSDTRIVIHPVVILGFFPFFVRRCRVKYRVMKTIALWYLSFLSFSAQEESQKIVIIGDSLTEGYGVNEQQNYPTLVEEMLKKSGYPTITVINAGSSGSTSNTAVTRLNWHLKQKPSLVVLALGANDGLRGYPVVQLEKNLESAIKVCKKNKIPLLLVGMKVPPNYGKKYQKQFNSVFPTLAKRHHLPFIEFLLEGVAGNPKLNLPDGIHPNSKGYEIVAKTLFNAILPLLKEKK